MVWNGEIAPNNRNAWQIPKKEVRLHEESSAVETLNIYPENISLPPHLIQKCENSWNLDILDEVDKWYLVEPFYYPVSVWKNIFYSVLGGWIENFYAVAGGWAAISDFYTAMEGWNFSFYSTPDGWATTVFYPFPLAWSDFDPAEGRTIPIVEGTWKETFYSAGGIWTIED